MKTDSADVIISIVLLYTYNEERADRAEIRKLGKYDDVIIAD